MATNDERIKLVRENSALRNVMELELVEAAVVVAAELPATDNHANRMAWAQSVINNPTSMAKNMVRIIGATEKASTIGDIGELSSRDAQRLIAAHINVLAGEV